MRFRSPVMLFLISTHAPRTGSDSAYSPIFASVVSFQPTLPARGATPAITMRTFRVCYFNPRSPHGERLRSDASSIDSLIISTHAPRTGSDPGHPPPPPGAHQPRVWGGGGSQKFTPPPPDRGADTRRRAKCQQAICISTHAPRTGSDTLSRFTISTFLDFNPRSPHGERQRKSDRRD